MVKFFSIFNNPHHRLMRDVMMAIFFYGLSLVFILPPFEGIDETAHFSRLISDSYPLDRDQSLKVAGDVNPSVRMTAETYRYFREGPMPDSWIKFDANHRLDPVKGGYKSYADFFHDSTARHQYQENYRNHALRPGFRPGPEPNWQYQHPFLYYNLLSPFVRLAVGHLSFVSSLTLLRTLSYLIAILGYGLGLLALIRCAAMTNPSRPNDVIYFGIFYPFLAPQFFWQFARVGNDSLCLFLFGLSLFLFFELIGRQKAWLAQYLGIVLGIGWFVKATMIPISMGFMLSLVAYWFCNRQRSPQRLEGRKVLECTSIMLVVGLPSYLLNALLYHSYGSHELQNLTEGLIDFKRMSHLFSFSHFFHDLGVIQRTAIWGHGGWSDVTLAHDLADWYYVIFDVLFVSFGLSIIHSARWDKIHTLIILFVFIAGLSFHSILVNAINPNDHFTPGWYVHIFAPVFVLIYGYGLKKLCCNSVLWALLWGFIFICAIYDFFLNLVLVTHYAGCGGAEDRIPISSVIHCLARPHELYLALSVLAHPLVYIVSYSFGLTYLCTALIRVVCERRVLFSTNRDVSHPIRNG